VDTSTGILSEATQAFGQTTLIESDPGEETCRDAIYAPFRPDRFFDRDPQPTAVGRISV